MSSNARFDSFFRPSSAPRREQVFHLRGITFYDVLNEFVKRLLDYDSGHFSDPFPTVTVCLKSDNAPVESRDWSLEYFEELKGVIESVRAKRRSVFLKVVVDGFHDESRSFDSIREFTFATQPPALRGSREDEEGFAFVQLDDVFVCRVATDGYPSEDEDAKPYFDDMGDQAEYYSELWAEAGEYDARYHGYSGRPTRLHEYAQFRSV